MEISNSPIFSIFEEFQKLNIKLAKDFYSGIESQIKEWNDIPRALFVRFNYSFVKELEKAHGTPEKAKLIAELGWVIPRSATLAEYAAIIAPINDIRSADEAFTNFYLNDNAIELEGLKKSLLKSNDIKTWRPALEEAFLDLDDGRHMSCIALLMPLIDGVTSTKFSEPNFYKSDNREAFFNKKLRVIKAESLNKYLWQSYKAFADNFFRSCQSPPSFLNRHWLLHGRDIPSSNKSDCLRLLQALQTITFLR